MLIGEVAQRCGVSARMLRHYDRLGLVTPTGRTSGGYREYSTDDVRRLFHVESLRTLGFTLDEVKDALAEPDFTPDALITEVMSRTRERIAAEQALLTRLERVQRSAPADWADVVHVVTRARALESDSGARRQQAVLAASDTSITVDDLVAAVLAEQDVNVAGALRWALARHGVRALPGLVDGLDAPDADIRRRAVLAIAVIEDSTALAPLRNAIDDVDVDVRDRAAIALAQHGDATGLTVLIDMVGAGRRDVEAAEALGRLSVHGPTDIVDHLHASYDAAVEDASRLRITQALGEIASPAADVMLARLSAAPSRTIAATAQIILAGRARG